MIRAGVGRPDRDPNCDPKSFPQEADCCAFLDLSLETSDEELLLTLAAPEEARLIVDDLVRSFRSGD